jgi:hypothetical protein
MNIEEEIQKTVSSLVWVSVYDSVCIPTNQSVENSVYNSVYKTVHISLLNSVRNSVCGRIVDEIEEYDY